MAGDLGFRSTSCGMRVCSQTSFQPKKAESGSSWCRARRWRRSVSGRPGAPGRCWPPTRPRPGCAAPAPPAPATCREARAACMSAIDCPRRCGRTARAVVRAVSMPSAASSAGSTSCAWRCMKSGPQAHRRARRRLAVAGARIHQPAPAQRLAQPRREVAPHRHRAQTFVQEHHQRRALRSAVAHPGVFDAQVGCPASLEVDNPGSTGSAGFRQLPGRAA
jgi:hypothetical protein